MGVVALTSAEYEKRIEAASKKYLDEHFDEVFEAFEENGCWTANKEEMM
jgi:hypothetical protein